MLLLQLIPFCLTGPSKPLNVHFDYDESDNVVVRWSHPDNPNAPLSKFRIKFFDNDTDFAYEEQLNYSYTVKYSYELQRNINDIILDFCTIVTGTHIRFENICYDDRGR